jgi:hypothetical protein
MKTLLRIVLISCVVVFTLPAKAQSPDCKVLKDGVVMRDNKLYTFDKTGAMILVTEDMELSNGTKVMKNGDYKTTTGPKSKLKNGEILTAKGDMMILSDNTVKLTGTSMEDAEIVTSNGDLVVKKTDVFMMDGIVIRGGKALKWDMGKYVPIVADMNLGTSGAKVSPVGVVTNKDGSTIKLSEGTFINAKGEMAFSKNDVLYDGVFKRDGKMMIIEKGKVSPMTADYSVAGGSKVNAEGAMVFSGGEKLALREGEMVLATGEVILLKAGKVDSKDLNDRKTTDHYIFRSGKMMLVKDGEPQILNSDITFTSGNKLLKHGHVMKKDGTKHILKEGEKIDMDGNFIVDKSKVEYDEKNNLVMKNGKMMVVKDGKETILLSEMLMPDWSKIYPDGTVEKQNGTKTKMKEGERLNMEGEPMSKISTGFTPTTTSQTVVTLKGGKMIVVLGDKEIPLSKERILNNGSKIMVDGTISKKDGSSFKLKEGDKADYNTGEIIK